MQIVSTIFCRVTLSIVFAVWLKMGVIGIAFAMVCDWTIRAILYMQRYRSDKWKQFEVIYWIETNLIGIIHVNLRR